MEFGPNVGGTFFQVSYEAILVGSKSVNGGSNVPVREMVLFNPKGNNEFCVRRISMFTKTF